MLTPVVTDRGAQSRRIVSEYLGQLVLTLEGWSIEGLLQAAELFHQAHDHRRTIFTLGNGGSAASASHLASDLNHTVSRRKALKFRAICLCDNLPLLTAVANDMDYQAIFVEPLRNLLAPGDLVVAISASGNSANVLSAVRYANDHGATTLGVTGFDGGQLKSLARHCVLAPVHDMQMAEDMHLVFIHLMTRVLVTC